MEIISGAFRGNVQKKKFCKECAIDYLSERLEDFGEDRCVCHG